MKRRTSMILGFLLAALLTVSLLSMTTLAEESAETTEVTVGGEATHYNGYVPFDTYFEYSKSQTIIPASYLTALNGKSITGLSYFVMEGPGHTVDADIILTETELTSLTEFVSVADSAVVYSDAVVVPASGEMHITFDTPFDYSGGNLLVTVLNNTGSYSSDRTYFYGVSSNDAGSLFSYRGTSPYDSSDAGDGELTSPPFLPEMTFYAVEPPTRYPLWIGDVQVTSNNKDNIPGVTGGTAAYDPDTQVLTMNGVTGIEGSHERAKIYTEADLTITGSCVIDASGVARGIYTTGNLALDGDIEITNADDLSVYVNGSKNIIINGGTIRISSDETRFGLVGGTQSILTINDGDITIDSFGSDDYGNGYGINVGYFYMKGGKLSATGYGIGLFSYYFNQTGGSIYAEGQHKQGILVGNGSSPDFYIRGNVEAVTQAEDKPAIQSYRSTIRIHSDYHIKEPAGAGIINEGNGQTIVNRDQTYADHVIITEKPVPYDLYIAGTQVNADNARDLTVIEGVSVAEGGEASFDPETNTLTLKDASIDGTSYYNYGNYATISVMSSIETLNISFSGTNTIGCEGNTNGMSNALGGLYTAFVFTGADDAVLNINARTTPTAENGAARVGSITVNSGTVCCVAPEEQYTGNNYQNNPYGITLNATSGDLLTVNGGKLICKGWAPVVAGPLEGRVSEGTELRGSANYDGSGLEDYDYSTNGYYNGSSKFQGTYRYVEATPLNYYPFIDTDESLGATTYKAICWAYENGIVKGTDATHYSPNAPCSRANLTVMLWRLVGKPEFDAGDNPFSDVSPSLGNTTYKSILWAYQEGIIKGYNDGTFRPDDPTSRANMAVMLWRLAGKPTVTITECPFTDVDPSMGNTTYKAILWAYSVKLTKGTTATTFSPNDQCTRAQLAVFLYRMNDMHGYIH